MSRIVYSHRIQAILKQSVVELGLTLTLSDDKAEVSLAENEKLFRDLAESMALSFDKDDSSGFSTFIFRRK